MSSVIDNYHNVQQDILETFVDRGQLCKLAEPTVLPNGKRIPGLKLDQPRQLALMCTLVRFSHIAAQNTFITSEIQADTPAALEVSPEEYRLASLRYDLSKLRAKGLVERVPHSRRYRLLRVGSSVCLVLNSARIFSAAEFLAAIFPFDVGNSVWLPASGQSGETKLLTLQVGKQGRSTSPENTLAPPGCLPD